MPAAAEPIEKQAAKETTAILHAGKTSLGEKFRDSLAKLQPTEEKPPVEKVEAAAEPEKVEAKAEPSKEAAKPKKPASPLDVLVKPPEAAAPDKSAEEEAVLAKPFEEGSKDWRLARQKIEILENRLKTKPAPAAPQVDPKLVEERDAIAKERDEIKAKLESQARDIKAIDARLSDDYRALEETRGKAIKKVVGRFESYMGKGNGDALAEALTLPPGKVRSAQLKEIMAEMDPDDKAEVKGLILHAEEAEEQLRDFEADAPKRWEEVQQRRTLQLQEQAANNKKAVEANYQKVIEKLPEEFVTMRLVSDADDDGSWNADIKAALAEGVKLPLGEMTGEQASRAGVMEKLYPKLEKRLLEAHATIAEQSKRLEEFDRGEPDFKGNKGKVKSTIPASPAGKFHAALRAINSANDND